MNRDEYRKAMEVIKPADDLESRLLIKLGKKQESERAEERSRGRHRDKWQAMWKSKRAVAILCAVAVVLVGAFAMGKEFFQAQMPLVSENSFNFVAYAGEESAKEILPINAASVVLPHRKISYYPDKGVWSVGGRGQFAVEGENIKTITFHGETGEFTYTDRRKLKELESEGLLYVARFYVDKSRFPADMEHISESDFRKLWDAGHFDDLKEQVPDPSEYGIKRYKYEISTIGTQDEEGNSREEIQVTLRTGDNITRERKCIQRGKTVVVDYYEGYYTWPGNQPGDIHGGLSWNATGTVEAAASGDYVGRPEELPGDRITVTVEFEDGEIQEQQIQVSCDEEGRFVFELFPGKDGDDDGI